jgi:hypothetical protein
MNHSRLSFRPHLQAELLEDRMMLSTVSIFASGDMGDETMSLQVDGEVVQTWENVGTDLQEFVFESTSSITPDQVRIAFTNDAYLPNQGVDRNLNVQAMVLDGVTFHTDDPNVLSVGVWNPSSGSIESGYGQGQTLHANGFFEFSAASLESINFAGRTWQVVDGQPSEDDLFVDDLGDLALGGARGPLAISTELDVEGGEKYRLTLDARRALISGTVGQNGPWSTIGIDYYDNNGIRVGQEFIEINNATGVSGDRIYRVPDQATSAYLWAWIDDYQNPNDVTIPLKISEIDWQLDDTVTPEDTTPPEASFTSYTFDRFNQSSINFGVDFSDDQELAQIRTGVISVTDPSGNVSTPGIAFGPSTNTDSFQTLVFTMSAPNGDAWTVADNGEYKISLVSGQLSDVSGNFADGRELGTLTVEIAVPVDTTPPVVELVSSPGVITSPPTGGRGSDVQFTVTYTDNVGLGDLAQDRILVEGPNGYSGFGRGIAGGAADPNGFFEITYIPLPADGSWSSNENGLYTIRLVDGAVVDGFGNVTPGRELGSFEISILGDEVFG